MAFLGWGKKNDNLAPAQLGEVRPGAWLDEAIERWRWQSLTKKQRVQYDFLVSVRDLWMGLDQMMEARRLAHISAWKLENVDKYTALEAMKLDNEMMEERERWHNNKSRAKIREWEREQEEAQAWNKHQAFKNPPPPPPPPETQEQQEIRKTLNPMYMAAGMRAATEAFIADQIRKNGGTVSPEEAAEYDKLRRKVEQEIKDRGYE